MFQGEKEKRKEDQTFKKWVERLQIQDALKKEKGKAIRRRDYDFSVPRTLVRNEEKKERWWSCP